MSIQSLLNRACNDTAVYWAAPTPATDGHNEYDPPVEIDCRWEEELELIRDDNRQEVASRAMVFVTQDLDEQGMLFHGGLDDLTAEQKNDPRKITRAYEIRRFMKRLSLRMKNDYSRVALI